MTSLDLEQLKELLATATRGPWPVEQTGDGKRYTVGKGLVEGPNGYEVAEVYSDDCDRTVAEANAQLIARAPTLAGEVLRLERENAWQPIETAPKDGRFVLLHCPNGQLESGDVTIGAYWKEDERAENGRFRKGRWDGWLGMDVDIASSWCSPTHWRPLPAPPALSGDPQ